MTDLAPLRRRTHELRKASDRRAAAIAERDRIIRAARAGGMGVTAIARTAGLSTPGVRDILGRTPDTGVACDARALADAVAEAEAMEQRYARYRWRRDLAVLDALDAGAARADVMLVARLTYDQLSTIVKAGRSDEPRASYRPGRAGRTDWTWDRQRRADYAARRRSEVREGRREVARHGRQGYDDGCRCAACIEGRRAYDNERLN